ncbi:MAG: trigger factor [Butyrivibrio sp.]|nr:trigger factor [Butyrivibrio sp.]
MKKKVLVLLMGAMMLASLSACGSKSKDKAAEGASDGASADAAATESSVLDSLRDLDKLEVKTLSEINPEDYVTVGEYKGITVEAELHEVTDEDVENYLKNMIEQSPARVEITDRAVQNGDIVNIDYEGKFADSGEKFEGGTAQGADLEIGSGMFIPGFEDGLVGVKTGETKDLDLTFPEEYQATDLAGKKVVFSVKVNKIYEKSTEMTDEWAASFEIEGVGNLDQLRENSKKDLTQEAEDSYKEQLESTVLTKVNETSEFKEIPQEVYNRFLIYENKQLEYECQMYAMYGQVMTPSDLVVGMAQQEGNSDPDAFLKDAVTDIAQQYILFAAIAKKENIVISDEDVENYLKESYDKAGQTGFASYDEFRKTIEKSDFEAYREGLMANKVIDMMIENANIVAPSGDANASAEQSAADDNADAEKSAE